jgi:AbiTii
MSRFSQLIDQVSDEKTHSLSAVLLKAKVLAHQLKSRTFRQWVNSEIDGYKGDTPDLPDYRIIRCNLQGHFVGLFQSQVRNVPLSTSILEPNMRGLLAYQPIVQGIRYIEDLLSRDGPVAAGLDIQVIQYLRTHGERMGDMILNHAEKVIPRQALSALLASVRSRLLEFLLELRDKYPELDDNDSAATVISEADIDSVMKQKVYQNCTVFEGTEMGDIYQAGQAGAMGPGAKAEHINFFQVMRAA